MELSAPHTLQLLVANWAAVGKNVDALLGLNSQVPLAQIGFCVDCEMTKPFAS
jgi:hypothetical protein